MSQYPQQGGSQESGSPGGRRLSVAIVCFHSDLALLAATITSLQQSLTSPHTAIDADLTLVDNSCDASYAQRLQELLASRSWPEFSSVKTLPMTENAGFGIAHNRALEQADSDYHLILNPDVELSTDALKQALDHFQQHPQVVLAGPSATNDQGDNQYLCKRYPSVLVLALRAFAPGFLRGLFARRLQRYEMRAMVAANRVAEVPLVSGCCMFARTAALRRVGGFGAGYFMYFEDYDLSLRMAELGQVQFLPQVHIVHHGGYSARKGWGHIRMFTRSGWRFFQTHGWRWI